MGLQAEHTSLAHQHPANDSICFTQTCLGGWYHNKWCGTYLEVTHGEAMLLHVGTVVKVTTALHLHVPAHQLQHNITLVTTHTHTHIHGNRTVTKTHSSTTHTLRDKQQCNPDPFTTHLPTIHTLKT